MSFATTPAIASAFILAGAVFIKILGIDIDINIDTIINTAHDATTFIWGFVYSSISPITNEYCSEINGRQVLSYTCVILMIVYLYPKWRESRRIYHLIEKIPGPPVHPFPLVGHSKVVLDLDRRKSEFGTYALVYQMLMGVYCLYGNEKLLRMWLGFRPFVVLFDPDSVEAVLSSNVLTEKSIEYNWLKPWLGEGLVTSDKSKWKQRRKVLTPAFHFKILQDFLPVMNEQADILVRKITTLHREGKTNPYPNLLELLTLCTLDTICETAMGTSVNAQTSDQSDYVKSLHQVSQLMIYRLTRPWFWPDVTFYASSHGRKFKKCLKNMHDFAAKVIQERKKVWINNNKHLLASEDEKDKKDPEDFSETSKGGKRLVFLDLLLHQHLVNHSLTEDDMREEVETFMFAGHDTTAMAISWTLYMLGLHPEIQDKVRQEVDAIFDEEEASLQTSEQQNNNNEGDANQSTQSTHTNVTEEMMKKMKYLDCVLKEIQRVYPTAPFIGREVTEETEICGYLIPKGTGAGVLTFLLHRNPKCFPNPEKFDPDRFLPENCIGRHPYAYVPFSAGPRNCIGQKFALSEQKIVVSSLIRKFVFTSVDHRDKLVVVGEMVLRPKNNLRVKIEPRSDRKIPWSKQSNEMSAKPVRSESPPYATRVL